LEENTGLKKLGTNENNQNDSSMVFSFFHSFNHVPGLQQTLVFLSVVFCYSKQLN